jgi:hypothetical protein
VLLNAERSFRRLKGHRQMPLLVAALARHIEAATPACDIANVASGASASTVNQPSARMLAVRWPAEGLHPGDQVLHAAAVAAGPGRARHAVVGDRQPNGLAGDARLGGAVACRAVPPHVGHRLAQHLYGLARPDGVPDRSALPIAGDDHVAKTEVTSLLDTLGWDTVDAGSLADSGRMHLGTPVSVAPYRSTPDIFTDPGAPVSADKIRSLLAAATR